MTQGRDGFYDTDESQIRTGSGVRRTVCKARLSLREYLDAIPPPAPRFGTVPWPLVLGTMRSLGVPAWPSPTASFSLGSIALQVGLIDQSQLFAAFQGWARDKARPLADYLTDLGAEGRVAVEAMVALHVKKHGGDTEQSLASIHAGRSTRERLAAVGDPDLTRTVARLVAGSTEFVRRSNGG